MPFLTAALVIGGAGIASSAISAREQGKANKQAAAVASQAEANRNAIARDQFELQKRLIAEGRPLREALIRSGASTIPRFSEASLEALEGIRGDITREPGTGPLFETALRRGTEGIFRSLAPFGLSDSSAAGRAVGEFTEGLTARDIAQIRDARFRAAGFAPQGSGGGLQAGVGIGGQAVGLTGQATSLAGLRSRLAQESPTAGLFADISRAGVNLGTQLALGSAFPTGGG